MMNVEVVIAHLRQLDDPICAEAADMIIDLNKRYQELGRSFDAMSADLLKLYEAYGKLNRSSSIDRRE